MLIINELKLAKELIKFPSITPVDAGTINFLSRKLRSLGFKCKILEFKTKTSKPVKNLYARLGKSRPNFCYAGHTDVVPPGNINDWTVNPFKPAVKKNNLIGRGANDMKSSIACFVAAVSRFKARNKKFKGSLSLLITGDEEGIAINGTKRVVEYLKKERLENAHISLRGERDNTWNDIQKKEKEKELSEDDKFRHKEEMQKIIDEEIKNLEALAGKKEKEILS